MTVDRDLPGVEIDDQLTCPDRGSAVGLGSAGDRLNACDQLALIEKISQYVTVTKSETFDPVIELRKAQEDQDRCVDTCVAQLLQQIVTTCIPRTQIQENDIVI